MEKSNTSGPEGSLFSKEYPHFIEQIIIEDFKTGKHQQLVTRFPPEPNGFLHIGHAKAICLNFGLSETVGPAKCHLRFDDTNPEKEEEKYVEAIKKDIQWLGFDWKENLFHASDYFEQLYQFAVQLIEKGHAYVDEQSAEEMRATRGDLKNPGTNSPYRDRPVPENLELFQKMRSGELEEGSCVLRAKIAMDSPNMNMRDPAIYRIRKVTHQRTGDQWKIYPMYDFAHPLSDAIEGITHSLCTLEFQDHRPLYDWLVEKLFEVGKRPRQIEFARLNLNFTVTSKRKLLQLVEEGHVSGWDDPRMPTISGMRRRGIPPKAIRDFCEYISIGKKDTVIDFGLLDKFVRDELNRTSLRFMGVLKPLKVVITNWPEDRTDSIEVVLNPEDESAGIRKIKLGREIYIEQGDFLEDPPSPKKWFRLGPGRAVRLRYGPIIVCDDYSKDDNGQITELKCRYIEDSFGGKTPEGIKKPKGIVHWVDSKSSKDVQVHLYDRLFAHPSPVSAAKKENKDYLDYINPDSLETTMAKVDEEALKYSERPIQLERVGYFVNDSGSSETALNRIVTLKDSWAKIAESLS